MATITTEPQRLVHEFTPLIRKIAGWILREHSPYIEADDVTQAGWVGLLEALQRFENGHGASFETFAGTRVRGAMLDELWRQSPKSRALHRKAKRAPQAVREMPPQWVSLDELEELGAVSVQVDNRPGSDPAEAALRDAMARATATALRGLPARERDAVMLGLTKDTTNGAIGATMGITEAGVRKLKGQAVQRLRETLRSWCDA